MKRYEAGEGAQEIVADKRACRQILLNLMSNAIKFTPPGGAVTIEARYEGGTVKMFVTDTGIGIGADDLPHLGAPFLSLVRGLVGLHGGAMKLESAPGAGTRVTVSLPIDCRRPIGATVGSVSIIETVARAPSQSERPIVELAPGQEKRFA